MHERVKLFASGAHTRSDIFENKSSNTVKFVKHIKRDY